MTIFHLFEAGIANAISSSKRMKNNIIDTKQTAPKLKYLINWACVTNFSGILFNMQGGGPRVVVNTAAFHFSIPGLKETKNVSSPSTCESQYCGEPP